MNRWCCRSRPTREPTGLGRFGEFGGRFVPETLVPALEELEAEFRTAWASDEFRAELGDAPHRLRGPADAGHRVPPPLGAARPAGAAQARGPHPHRLAQDQQRARPGAADAAHGQAARDRGDRRGPARRRDGHRGRAVRARLPGVHGRGRRRAPGAQRVPHAAARRRGDPRLVGQRDAQGRDQRRAARLGRERREHALLHRLGRRSAPVPVDRARVPTHRRRRGAGAVSGRRPAAIPTSSSRASAAGRTRSGPSPASSTRRRGSSAWRRAATASSRGSTARR